MSDPSATAGNQPQHVYTRSMPSDSHSSLHTLAGFLRAGSTVLDLGTGSGSLGRYLGEQLHCTVDGVTHSPAEAILARPHYRTLAVANLESGEWAQPSWAGQFDYIVCADVLEHLREPAHVLRQCLTLLKPDGILLVSVPNVGYSYLIAELMAGEFEYGPEGLLDQTHLRFFTRKSFERLLKACGWTCMASIPVDQPWHETEFRLRMDTLPEAVARHLLALPEGNAYQWVFAARPAHAVATLAASVTPARHFPAAAFLAQLYFAQAGEWVAQHPVNAMGEIGQAHQCLPFPLPNLPTPPTALRVDFADRSGYLHVHRIEIILASGHVELTLLGKDLAAAFPSQAHHLVNITPPDAGDDLWLLMTGDDPHITLPLTGDQLRNVAGPGCGLRVWCSWPWSRDYQAAIGRCTPATPRSSEPIQAMRSPLPAPASPPPWWQRLLGRMAAPPPATRTPRGVPLEPVTEIVLPVYNHVPLVRRCVDSVLSARNQAPWHMTIINDASPQAEVRPWLAELAKQHPHITILENVVNLGFVQTVNLGMRLAGQRDVVLLNSDTEVADHWLDRLRGAAYREGQVASVTPFSNNATICSWPLFCEENPYPSAARLKNINQTLGGLLANQSLEIPTAVGFCMYIARAALLAIGDFDAASFGLGYGEENDWCMRASKQGWHHLHALDVYVAHQGGVSFNEKRLALQAAALHQLLAKHPEYNDTVMAFVRRDPGRPYREAIGQLLDPSDATANPTQHQ